MQKKAAWFHCWVAALLAAMAALQFTSVRMESQTADEGRQLVSGYTYLLSGRFTVAIEHPPLLKLLWAIPVWFLHPDPPHAGDAWHAAVDSLRRNHTPAGQLLLAGRSSETASLCSPLFLYAADPSFLANGRYIRNDVGAAWSRLCSMCAGAAFVCGRGRPASSLRRD